MNKILTPMVECGTCNGSKLDPNSRENVTLDYDLTDGVIRKYYGRGENDFHEYQVRMDLRDEDDINDPCWKCKGFKYVKARYGDHYKTQNAADKGYANKHAKKCDICYGQGKFKYVHVVRDCISCSGVGSKPGWTEGATHVPDEVDLYDYPSKSFWEGWYKEVDMVVITDGKWTWNDAYLGLGGLVSCTDYGDMARLLVRDGEDAVIEKVRTDRSNGSDQMVKAVNKETRQIANLLAIRVTPQGYQLVPVIRDGDDIKKVDTTGYLLPPTYTDEVLNREV